MIIVLIFNILIYVHFICSSLYYFAILIESTVHCNEILLSQTKWPHLSVSAAQDV